MERQAAFPKGEAAVPFSGALELDDKPEQLAEPGYRELIFPFDIDYGEIESAQEFVRRPADGAVLRERLHEQITSGDISYQGAVIATRALIGITGKPGELHKLNYVVDSVWQEFGAADDTKGESRRLQIPMDGFLGMYVQAARTGVSQLEHYAHILRQYGTKSFDEVRKVYDATADQIAKSKTYDWQHWKDYFMARAATGRDPEALTPSILELREQEEAALEKVSTADIRSGKELADNVRQVGAGPESRFVLEPSPEVGHIIAQIGRLPSIKAAVTVLDTITGPLVDRITTIKDELEVEHLFDEFDLEMKFKNELFPLHVAETAFETIAFKRYLREAQASGTGLDEAIDGFLNSKSWHLERAKSSEAQALTYVDVFAKVVEPIGPEGRERAQGMLDALLAENSNGLLRTIERFESDAGTLIECAVEEAENPTSDGIEKFESFLDSVAVAAGVADSLSLIKARVSEGMSLADAKNAVMTESNAFGYVGAETVVSRWISEWRAEVSNYHASVRQSHEGFNPDRVLPFAPEQLGKDAQDHGFLQKIYSWNDPERAEHTVLKARQKIEAQLRSSKDDARARGNEGQKLLDSISRIEDSQQPGSRMQFDIEDIRDLGQRSFDGEPLAYPDRPGMPFNYEKIALLKQKVEHTLYGDDESPYGDILSLAEKVDHMLQRLKDSPSAQHGVHAYVEQRYGLKLGEPESFVEHMDTEALTEGFRDLVTNTRLILKSYTSGDALELTSGESADEPVDGPQEAEDNDHYIPEEALITLPGGVVVGTLEEGVGAMVDIAAALPRRRRRQARRSPEFRAAEELTRRVQV